ncbi:hypothetical protein AMELA_G00000190 [Ameiurus melas]|uniref:Uncharacterized protein n=1 Tax=Ameiurus melas TaxID=219545 RepID=A0A7J6BDW4_AMEME|nr:hypothetical protein AMELA_G00000190 [Ameiurus melas]
MKGLQFEIHEHKPIEFSDDETTGEEEQTEDEDDGDDDDEDDLEEEHDDKKEQEENKEPGDKTEQQEITVIQTIPQVKNVVEEAPVPDGPDQDSEDKDVSSPLIEEKLNQNEAKQERPKRLFGSNSKISLFKRRPSSKKEKSEAPVEESSPAEKAPGSDTRDVEQSSGIEASDSRPLRSHSATCTLL